MADEQNNATTQIITNKGLELLGKSPLTGANQTYWLGYFGFAYVPDEIKEQYHDEVPSAIRTTLTDHGDMIYNIWQGSMTPQGYQTDIGSSNAAELMTQCQYTNNIMSNFRYSLDKGRNTLSLYKRNADGTVTQWGKTFQGAGVDDNNDTQNSALPIPAALYYSTNAAEDGHVVTGDPRTYAAHSGQWGASSDDWNKEPTDVLDQLGKEYVSNFNKYHAPAISDGYLQGQEPSCRNMATVTKYFPVAHYTVTAAEGSKVSALKLTLTIDLNNIASKVANRTNFATMGEDEKPLNPVGFKFNRIGIYAAAMAVHHYTYDEENNQCQPVKDVQYQVIGDEEPKLFAIIDLDQAITIEEGSSLGKWTTDIIINFGNGESADSPIPRDTVVYYNLYEDDSIVWYKNQLIANASTSEAVTNLGIELNYLKNQIENIRSGSSCVMVDDTPYALLNHTHDYMRNLLDSGKASVINSASARKMANKPFKSDVLAYVGSDEDRFNTLQWYSLDDNLLGIGRKLNGENPDIPEDAAIQSERSPMVYTGGIALGGYGDTDSNFMLLRLGSQIDPEHTAWPQLQYDSNGILRNPCMWVPSSDVVTTTPNTPGKIYVKYEPDGNNVNHLLTKSPYAGHVLMVLEDQEIDGTLRVGLGKVQSLINPVMENISIVASYIGSGKYMQFQVERCGSVGYNVSEIQIKDPFLEQGTYTEGQVKKVSQSLTDGSITVDCWFKNHGSSNNEVVGLDITVDPQNTPVSLCLSRNGVWTSISETFDNKSYVHMKGQDDEVVNNLVDVHIKSGWFGKHGQGTEKVVTLSYPAMKDFGFDPNTGNKLVQKVVSFEHDYDLPTDQNRWVACRLTPLFLRKNSLDLYRAEGTGWCDGTLPYVATDVISSL